MSNLNSKLKPMDLHLKDQFHIHMVFASLSDQFEAFIVNRQLFAVSPYGYQSPSPWSKRKKELKLRMVVQSTMFTIKIKRPFKGKRQGSHAAKLSTKELHSGQGSVPPLQGEGALCVSNLPQCLPAIFLY